MGEYLEILENVEIVERLVMRDRFIRDGRNPFEEYPDDIFI